MNEKEHISQEAFEAFQQDQMNPSERELFLSHICSCDFCADRFTACMEEEIIAAPRDMKENLLRAVRKPEVQLAIRVRETSKRLQLFIYSLKVCTVTVCALLLMLFTMNAPAVSDILQTTGSIKTEATDKMDRGSLSSFIQNGINKIGSGIVDFSNNLFDKEVTDNDQ